MPDLAKLNVSFTADMSQLEKGAAVAEAAVGRVAKSATAAGKTVEKAFGQTSGAGLSKAAQMLERQYQQIDKAMSGGGMVSRAAEGFIAIETSANSAVVGVTRFSTGLDRIGAQTRVANQNIKLTANQMQGLGFQINDIATMLALGASPFQIIASQAGQVIQVLQQGGGLKSSIGAIGTSIASLATRIGPVGLAVGGVTAAAGALWYMMSDSKETRSAQKALEDYEKLIGRLEDGFGGAAEAAKRFFKEATQGSAESAIADTRRAVADLEKDLKAAIGDLGNNKSLDFQINPFRARGLSDTREQIRDLFLDLREGRKTAAEFDQELARIEMNPKAEKSMRDFAGQIRVADDSVQSLAAALGAAQAAAEELNKANGRGSRVTTSPNEPNPFDLRDRFGGGNPLADRLDPKGMDALRQGLKDQRDELTGATKDANAYSDKLQEMRASLGENVAGLRTQIETFGQSEGAIAAAKFQTDAMAEAQRLATEANQGAIDPALVDYIRQQAAEYGSLTDRLTGLREIEQQRRRDEQEATKHQERVADFESDLVFERSIVGLPEAEQRVRETLRGLDVDYDSFEGQRLAAGMRTNDQLREMQEQMQLAGDIGKDAFMGVVDALTQGGDVMDNLLPAFGGMGDMPQLFERTEA